MSSKGGIWPSEDFWIIKFGEDTAKIRTLKLLSNITKKGGCVLSYFVHFMCSRMDMRRLVNDDLNVATIFGLICNRTNCLANLEWSYDLFVKFHYKRWFIVIFIGKLN